MSVEDFLDAVAFREHLLPPPIDRWCDDIRAAAGAASFRGLG